MAEGSGSGERSDAIASDFRYLIYVGALQSTEGGGSTLSTFLPDQLSPHGGPGALPPLQLNGGIQLHTLIYPGDPRHGGSACDGQLPQLLGGPLSPEGPSSARVRRP